MYKQSVYFGSNTTRLCLLECVEGESADSSTRQCVSRCPSGSYGDYSARSCVKLCPITDSTFADDNQIYV